MHQIHSQNPQDKKKKLHKTHDLKHTHVHTLTYSHTHFLQSCAWGNTTEGLFCEAPAPSVLLGKTIKWGRALYWVSRQERHACGNQKVFRSFKLHEMDLPKHLSALRMKNRS